MSLPNAVMPCLAMLMTGMHDRYLCRFVDLYRAAGLSPRAKDGLEHKISIQIISPTKLASCPLWGTYRKPQEEVDAMRNTRFGSTQINRLPAPDDLIKSLCSLLSLSLKYLSRLESIRSC